MVCFGILLMLCQDPKPPPVVDVARFCRLAKPISWSRNDTEATRKEIRIHNAKGKALCGWGKKP